MTVTIEVVTGEDNKATDVILREKQDRIDEAKTLYGAYVIETNRKDLTSEEIWHLYMTLTKVEGAFRALKSDLGLRPIHHQLARRTAAHLFISVLAYHLYSAISSHFQKLETPDRCQQFLANSKPTPDSQ
ncbi:transposase [mine drainage metagenome]|uniref:Transposase n=1 Tax=mine drainage metagenome TaxID=410659 RepID=T0ZY44_9ZZZZ